MATQSPQNQEPDQVKRSDARRNEATLLAAAARVFAASGVSAPIRQIAEEANVGVGTVYRHFPSRADLVIAVYRHQVEACAESGPELLASTDSPALALRQWIDQFVDFLATKHGLAEVANAGDESFAGLHDYFLDHLVPVCAELLEASAQAGEITVDIGPYELMRGVGNLCIGSHDDDRYEPRRLIDALLDGLKSPTE
ncbi:MAG: TetR/AcrR family transcriptional regulator [Actinomycetota bacterium]